jgi:hypothetical protein
MVDQQEQASSVNLKLAVCWIAGVLLAVLVTLAFSLENGRLAPVSEEVLKWIGQVLGPICVLVLSNAFGLRIVKQFGARVNRQTVYRLAFAMSLVFMAFAVGTIFVAAFARDAGKDTPEAKLRQLQTLSSTGTMILMVLIWPILSLLLEYLFPKGETGPSVPENLPARPGNLGE